MFRSPVGQSGETIFRLKVPTCEDLLATKGEYRTLDEAIDAALRFDLDLAASVIEWNGARCSVNDWITFRIRIPGRLY